MSIPTHSSIPHIVVARDLVPVELPHERALQVDVALFGDDDWVVPALHDSAILDGESQNIF